MPLKTLVSPIENIVDPNETKVLAIINHLLPTLKPWREGEDLRVEKVQVNSLLDASEQAIIDLKPKIKSTESMLIAEEATGRKFLYLSIAIFILGLVAYLATPIAALASLISALPLLKVSKSKKLAQYLKSSLASLNSELTSNDSAVRQSLARLDVIETELSARSGGFPNIKFASVGFELKVYNLAGRTILVDESGLENFVPFSTIDLSEISTEISEILTKVKGLLELPPLLSPNKISDEIDPDNCLYGEESQLQELVGEFTNNLAKLKDVTIELSIVNNYSLLIKRLINGAKDSTNSKFILISNNQNNNESVNIFNGQFSHLNNRESDSMVSMLTEIYKELENTCSKFSKARMTSVNHIHEGLAQILGRATWCSRKFFCPRTIVSPNYIQDLIGVDILHAHAMDLNELFDRLQSDEVIQKRISKKPDLLEQLSQAYEVVHSFNSYQMINDSEGGISSSQYSRQMQGQLDQSIKLFRIVLNKILTGSSFPVLNFSNEAQLFFDPENDEWTSDITQYVYRTPDVMKYGSVVKAHYDIMIPLWEHLWTEKADFRKSELFRTNEAMINMSEKESEKLLEVGNQFAAEMRTNRENIYLIEADLNSKYDEILSFRDGMNALGLLSERVMRQISDEQLKRLIVSDSPLGAAKTYETTLALLPKAQAEVRGTVYDPIDMVRESNILLSSNNSSAPRLIAS
jgi:hypothetical protein